MWRFSDVSLSQKLSQELDATKNELQLTRANESAAIEAQSAIEKQCDELYAQWSDHLKQQALEIEQMQQKMVPTREIEMLRAQIQEELEAPYREKISKLSEAVEKYQKSFLAEQRQVAQLRASFAATLESEEKQRTQLADLLKSAQSSELELRQQLNRLTEDDSKQSQFICADFFGSPPSHTLFGGRDHPESRGQGRLAPSRSAADAA